MITTLLAATTTAAGTSDKIVIPSIRYLTILPPMIMIGGAVILLAVASLIRRPLRVRVSTIGSVIISGGAFGISIWQWCDVRAHGAHTYIAHAVVMDGFSVLITMLVTAAMLLTALVGDGYLRREGITGAEFHVLALISASGAMLMGSANDLIIIFLGLEILSIALYVLTATTGTPPRVRPRSSTSSSVGSPPRSSSTGSPLPTAPRARPTSLRLPTSCPRTSC